MSKFFAPRTIEELLALCGPGRPMMTISVELAPKLAKALLDRRNEKRQRGIRRKQVEFLKRLMLAGKFKHNPADNVCVDPDGHLVNAQHRLTAQWETNTTQVYQVTFNAPADSYDVIDCQAVRTAGDGLKVAGYENGNKMAAIAKIMAGLAGEANKDTRPQEVLAFAGDHPNCMQEAAKVCKRANCSGMSSRGSNVIAAACGWAFDTGVRVRPAFLSKVVDGEGLAKNTREYRLRAALNKAGSGYDARLRLAKRALREMATK